MVFWSINFFARGTRSIGSLLLDQTGLVSGEKKHHKISYYLIKILTSQKIRSEHLSGYFFGTELAIYRVETNLTGEIKWNFHSAKTLPS